MKSGSLSAKVGQKLKRQKSTLAIAESCTGGYVSHLITSVSGSSAYFVGGVVAYDNKVKRQVLSVRPNTLKKFGAVSSECASEMALGIQKKFGSAFGVATTGIAGPGGGVPGKPVGTVYIAVSGKKTLLVERCQFKGSRKRVIEQAAQKALEMLLSIV